MAAATITTEADILDQLVSPRKADFTPESARAILQLKFDAKATRTIRRLLQQNNNGKISADERLLMEKYLRVGQMLDLLQAKARLSIKSERQMK